jgi:hypothetical protein
MRSLIVIALASQAFAQPLSEAERKKLLQEMRTCMTASEKQAASGDTLFERGKYADAVRAYEASMGCAGTVPNAHEKAKVAVAACHAGDATTAKKYYATLLHVHRRGLDTLCGKRGIALRAPATRTVPAKLDADMIAETLEPLEDRLAICIMQKAANPNRGFRAMVAGTTAANGTVSRVDSGTPECAETILRNARFPTTKAGSAFAYEFFVDPSVLHPEKAIGLAERWFAAGKPRDAVRQWVWIAQSPEHLERALQMACDAKLGADATLFAWRLGRTGPICP